MFHFLKDSDGGFSKTLFLMVMPALYTLLYKFATMATPDMVAFGVAATGIIGTWVAREKIPATGKESGNAS